MIINENARVVSHRLIYTCACCGEQGGKEWVDSLYAACDPRYAQRMPQMPDGWQQVEGLAYCPRHDVSLTATIRTPTVVRLGSGFIAGHVEELVELRASHIQHMMDEMYEGAKEASGAGCVGADSREREYGTIRG